MGDDASLFLLLGRTSHALTRFIDRELDARLGLSSTQLAALVQLSGREGCTLKELAAGLGLNPSAVTALARRLERDGLAVRAANARDGRAVSLWLTDDGHRMVTAAAPLMAEFDNRLTEGLSPADEAILTAALARLLRRFNPEAVRVPGRGWRPPPRRGRHGPS